jgi:hypothetical protein
MIEQISRLLSQCNYDIRISNDARFIDQKVTPDVLSIIADCILNYVGNRNDLDFTKDEIWNSPYFNNNIATIFNKPDTQNHTARLEYDKFTSQPLKALAYAGVLSVDKRDRINYFRINNREILQFIADRERNAFIFLTHYIEKVLSDSGFYRHFERLNQLYRDNALTNEEFQEFKRRFQRLIIGNTNINGNTEVNRILPKVFNILAVQNNMPGTIKGRLSQNQFYYSDLMYNRTNWRDRNKAKNLTRQETENLHITQNVYYANYLVQRAKAIIRRLYKHSEVRDHWGNGSATQVHHIFPQSQFRSIAHYLENLILITPTQHFTKAHPNNNTQVINTDYQLVCLLAKSASIETSLNNREVYYSKESFVFVINTGLNKQLNPNSGFDSINRELVSFYNT